MEAIAGLLLAVAAAACLATLGASAADAVPLGEGEAPGQGSPVRNCSRSGYCSLGHVRPFQGDIHTPQVSTRPCAPRGAVMGVTASPCDVAACSVGGRSRAHFGRWRAMHLQAGTTGHSLSRGCGRAVPDA